MAERKVPNAPSVRAATQEPQPDNQIRTIAIPKPPKKRERKKNKMKAGAVTFFRKLR